MKVKDILAKSNSTLFTFELMPPLKGTGIQEIYQTIEQLLPYNPSYINITSHRSEVEFREQKDGRLEKVVTRKRPGTVAIAASIQYKYGIDVVPHILCGGFNKVETEDALMDLAFMGVENLLILRGDALKNERGFMPESNGHTHACDLVKQVVDLNNGKYLDPQMINAAPTNFCMGVAGYPEKHIEAPNLETDLRHLKAKVDAGADYIVTQLFFDNKKFFDFVKKCREIGITVPIIPGIKPIAVEKHLNILPQTFNIDLPEDLVKAVKACKNNDEVRQVGVEWGIAQCQELKAAGVPVIHFYTMSKADNIAKIVNAIF